MNTDNPLVSILIPCYNHEKYIDDCLNSIINQTYDNIEVLITDDCSTDNSFEILKKRENDLKKKFVRVEISKNGTNKGVVITLNELINKTKGEFVKIIASDDMLTNDCIEVMISQAVDDRALLYFSNSVFVDECVSYSNYIKLGINKFTNLKHDNKNTIHEGNDTIKYLLDDCYIGAPTLLIPKNTFNIYGLFNAEYVMEDYEFILRCSINGNIKYVDKITVLNRVHNESLSRSRGGCNRERFIRFIMDKKKIFDKYSRYGDDKAIYKYYNIKLLGQLSDIDDKENYINIIKEMKRMKIKIANINKFKFLLFKVRLHSYYRKIVKILNCL